MSNEEKFKVGQVWESRSGTRFTITSIDYDGWNYPITATAVVSGKKEDFTAGGKFFNNVRESEYDLTRLVEDALTYVNSDGIPCRIKGLSLTTDKAGRHWLWSEQLKCNLAYKVKGREDTLLASIDSLLFHCKLRDQRIAELEQVHKLAMQLADHLKPDEES